MAMFLPIFDFGHFEAAQQSQQSRAATRSDHRSGDDAAVKVDYTVASVSARPPSLAPSYTCMSTYRARWACGYYTDNLDIYYIPRHEDRRKFPQYYIICSNCKEEDMQLFGRLMKMRLRYISHFSNKRLSCSRCNRTITRERRIIYSRLCLREFFRNLSFFETAPSAILPIGGRKQRYDKEQPDETAFLNKIVEVSNCTCVCSCGARYTRFA